MKSTGSRPPEGNAAARLGALKHGFFARSVANAKNNSDGTKLALVYGPPLHHNRERQDPISHSNAESSYL